MTNPKEAKDAITRAETARKTIEEARVSFDQANYRPGPDDLLLALARRASEAGARLAQLINEVGDDPEMINPKGGTGAAEDKREG